MATTNLLYQKETILGNSLRCKVETKWRRFGRDPWGQHETGDYDDDGWNFEYWCGNDIFHNSEIILHTMRKKQVKINEQFLLEQIE